MDTHVFGSLPDISKHFLDSTFFIKFEITVDSHALTSCNTENNFVYILHPSFCSNTLCNYDLIMTT